MSIIKIALVGAGERGKNCYAPHIRRGGDLMKFVAVAEPKEERRNEFVKKYNIEEANVFETGEELFTKPKLADAVMICTQDKQHFGHAKAAIEKGYSILMEKPISPDPKECLVLQKLAEEKGVSIIVCHVLRYTKIFREIKKQIDRGTIGEVVSVVHTENIGYWHFAHSYVRGNWRNESASAPMIIAKCCHDMDIISYLLGSRCKTVSSFGDLRYFKKENAPVGAPNRCLDGCPHSFSCEYFAPKFYLGCGDGWPASCISADLSEEGRLRALREGPYGKCVFAGGNDVCDHQIASMVFENGVTVAFTASAFSNNCERSIKIMGTRGEIETATSESTVKVTQFGQGQRTGNTDTIKIVKSPYGHNGGDEGIMETFALAMSGQQKNKNLFSQSVHSHIIGFAIEESRKTGKTVNIEEYEKSLQL